MPPIHIMHVIDSLALGGAERMLVEIANATYQDGYQVSVCVTRHRTDLARQLNPKIPLHVLGRQRRFDIQAMRQFAQLATSADILHVHGRSSFSFVAFLKTMSFLPFQLATVMHDHFGLIEHDSSVPRWFRFWGKHFVTFYVGVHPKLAEWARAAQIKPTRIAVVNNGLNLALLEQADSSDIYQEFNLAPNVPVGIIVGSIRYQKGFEFLLEVLSYQKQPYQLLVVGEIVKSKYAEDCLALVEKLGLKKQVIFTGPCTDVPSILKECDFALMSSRSESGPLVIIEYLNAGLPIVSTQVGEISKRAAELGVEKFVPFGDKAAFTTALDELLRLSPEQRKHRGEQGRAIARQYFDIRAILPQWYKIYAQCLESKKGA